MSTTADYIESGTLELYVFGVLEPSEMQEISAAAKESPAIQSEIIAVEKAIINLSSSFSPAISSENFEKIKSKLELKHNKVVQMAPKSNRMNYLGWAVSLALLFGAGYLYNKNSSVETSLAEASKAKLELEKQKFELDIKNKNTEVALNVLRDKNKMIISLAGQSISPNSSAKVYCDPKTKEVYVDVSNLPKPPEGMVYQVWSLKMNPLTPTSIGLIDDYGKNESKMFLVSQNGDAGAEGFGITLEPAGGSKTPTMEQLYALGTI